MIVLGLDAKLYRNTGNYASPTWVEVENVKDVTLGLSKSEADVTTRKNGGWRAIVGALKEGVVSFEMLWDTADTDFQAFLDAWLNDTSIEVLCLDGSVSAGGSEGLRATFSVIQFERQEPLEEAIKVAVTIKPTYADNAPSWHIVAS
jgi:predicted secreted protein